MLDWILQHRVALTAIAWLGNIIICIPFVWMAVNAFNYRRKYRRHLRISAQTLGRYAVFDSWVRSGGAPDELAKQVRDSILNDYRQAAYANGEAYLATYTQAESDAMRDLRAVVNATKKVNHE